MAKDKKNVQVDNLKEVESALTKTEQFLESNQKLISIVIGAIVVIAAGYLGLNRFYLEPRQKEAQDHEPPIARGHQSAPAQTNQSGGHRDLVG